MQPGESLQKAIWDYRFLLDLDYPVKATLKLVGDRYRLDKSERIVLFRGIHNALVSKKIAEGLIDRLSPDASIGIDGYNVLFTLLNYRNGHPLFIGTDGLLRDAGGAHGRIPSGDSFDEAGSLLLSALSRLGTGRVVLYLDAPVSGSGRLAALLRKRMEAELFTAEVHAVPSADPLIRGFKGTAVATSDSAIAVSSVSPVFDLARYILEEEFSAVFIDLSSFLH
jgi:hypothetical protein